MESGKHEKQRHDDCEAPVSRLPKACWAISNTMMRSSVYAEGIFKVMIKTGRVIKKEARVLDPTQSGKITTPVNSESFVYTVTPSIPTPKR